MNNNLHEIEFIRSFVIPQKRSRFLEFIKSEKGRGKFTAQLDHPNFILTDFASPIAPSGQTIQRIISILTNKGAPKICHIISSNDDIDAHALPTETALERTLAQGFGTILSFIPGKLAYFESEDGEMRFILEKYTARVRG